MTEPIAEYQAEQPSDAPSETPVADFLKRNPYCSQLDLFLFVLDQLPLRSGSQGDLNTAPNAVMIEVAGRLITGD